MFMIFIFLFLVLIVRPFVNTIFWEFMTDVVIYYERKNIENYHRQKRAEYWCDKFNKEAERRAYKWIFKKG